MTTQLPLQLCADRALIEFELEAQNWEYWQMDEASVER